MINLIQPISFFDRLTEQDGYKENSPKLHKFLADSRLIPFQIKVPSNINSILSFRIVGYRYIFEIDLVSPNTNFIKVVTAEAGKYVLFFGGENLVFRRISNYPNIPEEYDEEPLAFCPDYYHYEVKLDTGKIYYSEKFYIGGAGLCDEPITLEINAWNNNDRSNFTFTENFKFKCYFNSFIHAQEAIVTDDYHKDGYERQSLKIRVIQFPYSFEVNPLPYTISNGLAVLTTFDNFVIKENGNEYIANSIDFEIENIEGTSFNRVIFTFTLKGQDIIKTNC